MKKNFGLMALTGILVLASCGQGGGETTPDITAPTVSLTATPTTLTKDGGSVTLTGKATDASGIASVTITRNDGTVICSPTPAAADGAFSCTTTLPANAGANAITYTYTAKATDKATTPNSASASASVSVDGTTGGPIIGNYSLNITSPTAGSTVTSNSVQLTYTYSGLTDLMCGISGGTMTAATNPGSSSGACTIDITSAANGNVTLAVQGKDSTGAVRTATVSVNKNVVVATGPVLGPIMQPDANGYIDYTKYRNGGVRCIDQANWKPSGDPLPGTTAGCATYLKGNVDITFTAPTGASRVEAWVHGSIDGSKTGALKYLYDGAPGGKITWNTTDVNGQQSRILYMVVRTYNGTSSTTKSYPFIVDNTGPQPSDPDFEGAAETGSRLLRDFGNIPNNNWAKGKVQLFTSNANLSDLVYNPASEQIYPAGVDSVTYYMVPLSKLNRIGTIQGQQRVLDIIANSSYNTGAVQYASPNFPNKRDFRTMFDGVGKSDGQYAIFSVTIDEMGNESASTTYENLGLDNTGPSTQAVSLYDASPLPFPSADPQRYISDWFRISGALVDNGIGFNTSALLNGGLSFCGQVLPSLQLFAPIPGSTNTIGFNDVLLDSNTVVPSDGECEVTFNAPDALGNVANYTGQKVIFDNTDPVNDIQQPPEGATFTAGTTVNFESNISDVTSGINPNYTKTFWNDYIADDETYANGYPLARTRANGFIAAPVEFRSDPINSTTPNTITSLNAGWFALYPGLNAAQDTAATRPMQLHSLVVDCAGNATIKNRRVQVAKASTLNRLPKLGDYDVYYRGYAPAYSVSPTSDASHWYVTGSGIFDTTVDINMDMTTSAGALANVGNPDSTGTFSRNSSVIKEVNFFRQLDIAAWNNIVYYQTHVYVPATSSIVGDMVTNTFNLYSGDPTLYVRGGSDLMTRRGAWGHLTENLTGQYPPQAKELYPTAPWWLAGDTMTSSDFYRTTTALRGAFAFAGASALNGMATDNVGTYRANMENTAVISTLNTTPATVLAQTYTAPGSTVDRFQFVVTTPIPLNITTAGSPLPAGTYALQGRNPTTGAWESIDNSVVRGSVTYVSDLGTNQPLVAGVNNLQAIYTFGTRKYAEFRFAAGAGIQFPGQSFTVNVQ